MKKLIMMLTVVVIATTVRASAVSWGLNGALDTSTYADGSKLYLFAGNSSNVAKLTTEWAATVTSFTFDNVKTQLGADLAVLNLASGGTAPNTLTLSSGLASSTGNSATSYGSGNSTGSYSVFAVVIANDGKNVGVSNAKTINVSASPAPAMAMWAASNFTTLSAVPEPTSGLLLLLGMAGLALKRKRA